MTAIPGQVIAGSFALCAFSIAILAGLAAENDALTILVRAFFAMCLCYGIGRIAGLICVRAIAPQTEPDLAAESQENESDTDSGRLKSGGGGESVENGKMTPA